MAFDRRGFLKTGVALWAGAGLSRYGFAQDAAGGALARAADGALDGAVQQVAVPGVVAALTDRRGTVYQGAFGERRLGQGVPMTFDTVFYLASMTKPVTATAAMQLVEQGKLDLESPISRWVPRAAELQVLDGWTADGAPRLRAPKRPVTLRHLLTHTSGFAYNLWDAELDRYMTATGFPSLASGDDEAYYPPLMFDPGERWEYGISIDWVGKLVETVSDKSLGTYMQDHIFAPLGMRSTGYRLTPEMDQRRASAHQRDANGKLVPTDWVRQQDPLLESGGGGLYSSAGDYLQFVRMFLNGGEGDGVRVLAPETVARMSRNAMGETRVGMLKTQNPERSEDAEFFPGLAKSWGLSFMINEEPAPTGRPAGSLAWAGIMNTFFWIDPVNELGGVYLTQVLPFVDAQTLASFHSFEKAVYDALA